MPEKSHEENNPPLKILLIVEDAPEHPPFLSDIHPKIKVVFLSPNTTSLVQQLLKHTTQG